jgi:23S rRNA (guanosine2251-2'-O)-methyltransferase
MRRDRRKPPNSPPNAPSHTPPRNPQGRPERPASRHGQDKPEGTRREPRAQPSGPADRPAFRKGGGDVAILYGYHAVREALRVGRRRCLDLFVTAAAAARLAGEIGISGVTVHTVDNAALDRRLGPEAVHQGMMLEARPLPDDAIDDLAQIKIVLVLDQVTDPHNVGAILRTAVAFGVGGLVMTERHAPALDGVLAKSASGALEHMRIARVVNLARALDELGEAGFQRIGLDSSGDSDLATLPLSSPLALVLGAEGAGLRRLTRERCDVVARLNMPGPIKSLNVSNACAAALTLIRLSLKP